MLILSAILVLSLLAAAAPGQTQSSLAKHSLLPPLSWTCPMHPDVVEDQSGECPICGMHLAPVRLDSAWSCPVHTMITEAEPGQCPICQRDLVQITASLFWTCLGSDRHEHSPGRCPDGSERVAMRERRAHGDHNPRHGGQFFMAPDNWHHLEGAYPRAGLFRLFVYDDFTRPRPLDGIRARVVTKESFNPETRLTNEVETFPLKPSSDGRYLEAQIKPAELPVELTAKIRFSPDSNEYRFDFSFSEYTKETPAGAVLRPHPSPPALGTPAAPAAAPGNGQALVAELQVRTREVGALIDEGAFGAVWVPALAAKDVALTIEQLVGDAPEARRLRVAVAVKQLVAAAWLLDMYGDLGDKQKLTDAYDSFSAAVAALASAYGTW